MARQAFTRRFAALSAPGAGAFTIFTATDVHIWIIRDVIIQNSSGAAGRSQLFISAGSAAFFLFDGTLQTPAGQHLDVRQEILPSESLIWTTPSSGFSILVTGYAFEV